MKAKLILSTVMVCILRTKDFNKNSDLFVNFLHGLFIYIFKVCNKNILQFINKWFPFRVSFIFLISTNMMSIVFYVFL